MTTILELLKAILVAVGLVKEVRDEIEADKPELIDPPPPADSGALVHDLEAIRKRRFGK